MVHYIGLDVSLKQTSICVVNQVGSVVREGVVDSDPEAIAAFVRSNAPGAIRIGLETPSTRRREILLPAGLPPQHVRPIRSESRALLVARLRAAAVGSTNFLPTRTQMRKASPNASGAAFGKST
jgi:hypothetical protein